MTTPAVITNALKVARAPGTKKAATAAGGAIMAIDQPLVLGLKGFKGGSKAMKSDVAGEIRRRANV